MQKIPKLLSFDCHATKNEPRSAVNSAFPGSCTLLKLNRSRWFTGQIVEYSVHASYLVDDTAHYGLEDVERNFGGFCCHEVNGVDGTKGYGVVVGPFVTHDAYGTHICEGGKILAD